MGALSWIEEGVEGGFDRARLIRIKATAVLGMVAVVLHRHGGTITEVKSNGGKVLLAWWAVKAFTFGGLVRAFSSTVYANRSC